MLKEPCVREKPELGGKGVKIDFAQDTAGEKRSQYRTGFRMQILAKTRVYKGVCKGCVGEVSGASLKFGQVTNFCQL